MKGAPYRKSDKPRGRNGGRRPDAPLKKTPPTTVRLTSENHIFVKSRGDDHPDGQSGVINAAVTLYRKHVDDDLESILPATIKETLVHDTPDA